MASENGHARWSDRDRVRSTGVRFLLALTLVVVVAFVGTLASTSCVIDYRDPDSGTEAGEAASAPEATMADGEADGGAPEADLDCGCCNQAVLPLLPNCSGKTAFAFPAADCSVRCKGAVAYALCTGECFTACTCEVPAGYTLFDAGYFIGDGSAEETGSDASDARLDARDASDASREASQDASVDGGADAQDAHDGP
jgi:hypothetical protein